MSQKKAPRDYSSVANVNDARVEHAHFELRVDFEARRIRGLAKVLLPYNWRCTLMLCSAKQRRRRRVGFNVSCSFVSIQAGSAAAQNVCHVFPAAQLRVNFFNPDEEAVVSMAFLTPPSTPVGGVTLLFEPATDAQRSSSESFPSRQSLTSS